MNITKVIKASYKDCSLSDRALFKRSKCIVPISVGQSIHEGEKFKATIELINRTFQECTILIDDVVQRHTLKIANMEKSAEELYQKAIDEGKQWFARNRCAYNALTIPFKTITWEKWLNHVNFPKVHKEVNNQYNSNTKFKQAFHDNITEFLTRYKKHNEHLQFDYDTGYALCLDYLKEECACMCLFVEEKCEFEVYPSGRNKAMAVTYEFLIKPKYPNLLKSVALRFKKYPVTTNSASSVNLGHVLEYA